MSAAIAITARYTASQEAPKVAMLRAFGVSQVNLLKYYLRQLGTLWIGDVGEGWRVAMTTLSNERTTIGGEPKI